MRPMLLLAALVAAGGAVLYASTPDRSSTWRDHEIRVDGSDDEWKGEELPVEGQHFSLGIVNDGEWLYLCLPTKDGGTKQMIERAGLVVWLDREGGKKQQFGVQFPVPNPPGARPRREPPPASGGETTSREGEAREIAGQDQVGILGAGGRDAQLVPIEAAGGIEGRVAIHDDLMVLELKIPLARSDVHPYAPNVGPGQTVRLELETAPLRGNVMTMPPTVGGYPPRPWGGGWGIVIGGHGKPVIPEPFDVKMNLRLATEPAQ